MDVSRRLKEVRTRRKISLYRLAQLSKVSQSFLSAIEAGQKTPTVNTLEKICQGLNISLAEFFSGDEASNEPEPIQSLLEEARSLTPKQLELLTLFLASMKRG